MRTLDVRKQGAVSQRSVQVEALAQDLFGIVLQVKDEQLRSEWEALPHAERMIWLGCAVERIRCLRK